jgi:hypothetical protein
MKIDRAVMLCLAVGCASSATALADLPPAKPQTASYDPNPASIVSVRRLSNGQEIPQQHAAPRGTVIGYDNLNLPGSAAGLNVAYTAPASYTSPPPASSNANIFGLGNGPVGSSLRAPTNATITIPTDIIWNDYTGDPAVWPGGAGVNASGMEFDFVRVAINSTAVARTDTVNVLFFSADGTTFIDGFGVALATPAGFAAYQRVNVDLSAAAPPIQLPQDGLVMIDYLPVAGQTTIIGVGLIFEGGDLMDNVHYPTPQSLVQVGTEDPTIWVFADHVTGDANHPMGPDPDFDMVAGLSYLDVLNTGRLVDWGFTSATPAPARTLAHGFPILLMVGGAPASGACDVPGFGCFILSPADCTAQGGTYAGDGTTCPTGACHVTNPSPACIVTTQEDCTTLFGTYDGDGTTCCPCDFNGANGVNSQDFFDFLNCFFDPGQCLPGHDADFNNDGFTNSQDFFDFLNCFFAPPPGC